MVNDKGLLAVAQKANSSEAVAAAKKKADRESARVSNALARQRSQYLILKLQSGFRGFNARKNVWTLKNGGRALNEKDMGDGLGQLGRSPSSTLGRNPTFMSFTLRFQKINDCSLLAKYPLLTTVDVTQNHIPTLEALSVMPYLWKVVAGHNSVTKAIDFAAVPPEFRSDGDESIGSSLRYLDLEYNMVSQLEEKMGRHPLLTDLNLSHNRLTGNLNALRPLQMLRKLDVSFNSLTSDWGLAGLPIETLSLADNQLNSLEETGELARLVDLNIQNNKISSLHGLRACVKLLSLDVRCNLVEDIDELCHLKDVQALLVEENPMFVPGRLMTGDEFRLHVVARLQSLVKLDGRVVTTEDKVRAVNALDFPGHEREERRMTWQRAFDPTGVEAAARRAEHVAHDRQSLVDLEFKDHLPAMPPIGSMKGKGPPPFQGTSARSGAVGTETGEQDPEERGSSIGLRAATRSRGTIEPGGRKSSHHDVVARGLSEMKHFAVVGSKPKGADTDQFPKSPHPQPFESVLEIEVLNATTGEIVHGALVSLHPGSGPNAPAVTLLPQSQASSLPIPGLGKSPSLPASGDRWAQEPLVINRHTDHHGICEVRVDASTLKHPLIVPGEVSSGDDNSLMEEDDEEDDHSLISSADSVSSSLSSTKKLSNSKVGAVPCCVLVKSPGYACLDAPLPGIQWPLAAGLLGGHRKRVTVTMMPLLGKPLVSAPAVHHHEHSKSKQRHNHRHDQEKTDKTGIAATAAKKSAIESWHPAGSAIKVSLDVPPELVKSAIGGNLDVAIPPGSFTSRGSQGLGAPFVGLVRVLVTASFYNPSTLPGTPRLFSTNHNGSINAGIIGADRLLVGRVGFAIEAFSTLGESLDLRLGVGIDVSLTVDTMLKPQLAVAGSALSSIPRLTRFDNESGFWRADDDARSTLALLVRSDGSRLRLPTASSTLSLAQLPEVHSTENVKTKTKQSLICEAPGQGLVSHCCNLVIQRLPYAFCGDEELAVLENLLCGMLPVALVEWTNGDGDFSRDAAAITNSVNTICGALAYLRRHCHRAIVVELKKTLAGMIKTSRDSLASSATAASLVTLTSSSLNHNEGGASVVAAFRAKHKAKKLQQESKAKEAAAAAPTVGDTKSNLKSDTKEEVDISVWDEAATPGVVELDHALSLILKTTFESWPTPLGSGNLTAEVINGGGPTRQRSFDSDVTFNTTPLQDTGDDFDEVEDDMPTLESVIVQAAEHLASWPRFSSVIRTKALTEVCPDLSKATALGLLVAHGGDVSAAALKARELTAPPTGDAVVKSKGNNASEVLGPIDRHNKLRSGLRQRLSQDSSIWRAPLSMQELDAALVKAVGSSGGSGSANTPGWALDNAAIVSAANDLSAGPVLALRHSVALKCIAWPHLPGPIGGLSSKSEVGFASGVSLGIGDQLGLWCGSEVIAAVDKVVHGKGKKSDASVAKKEDKKSKAKDSTPTDFTGVDPALVDAVWVELCSLDHIKPLIALYNSSSFAKSLRVVHNRSGSDGDEANGGKVELPIADDVGSLALTYPQRSSVLSLFGPQQDDQSALKEDAPPESQHLIDATVEEDIGLQGAADVVSSLNRVMGTMWLCDRKERAPLIRAGDFTKEVYSNLEPAEVASRAVTHFQASTHQKVASRLAKLRSIVFAALDMRGFPRVSEEFGTGGGSCHSVEILGPAEATAVLDLCKQDVAPAADILLSSPALLRRCLLHEVKLRAQDSLCATALGPAASCVAEGSFCVSDAETKHFVWLESILRRHPHVCLSMTEVSKAIEWATEIVESLEREEQNIIPRHENSMNESDFGPASPLSTDGASNKFSSEREGEVPIVAAATGDQIELPTSHHKHHKHHKSRSGKGSNAKKSAQLSVAQPSIHEDSTIHRVNPVKAAALRTEAITIRAIESLCGNGTIVVRHRIAVETSQWSCMKVAESLGVTLDEEEELVSKGDAQFAAIEAAETAARQPDDFSLEEVASPNPSTGKAGGGKPTKTDSKLEAKATATTLVSPNLDKNVPTMLHLDNPVTGRKLMEGPALVFATDIARVPILFKRSEVRSTVASFKGRTGADNSLVSLHASVKSVQSLHGPNHLRRLGLSGALPLTHAECERALNAAMGELGPALDLLCLDPAVVLRYEMWRVKARVKEALSPEAAANFSASSHLSGHTVEVALQEASIAAIEAVANVSQIDAAAQPAATVAAPAATSPAKESKNTKSGGKKNSTGKSPLKTTASVRMSVISPAEEESVLDPNLAELVAIGEVPQIPEFTSFCPKLAEETAKQQKSFKKKGRGPATPKPEKDSRRPSMASQADGPANNEADIEAMASMRFETIAAVYNRSRKLADRAATQLLVAPAPKKFVFDPATSDPQSSARQNSNGCALPAVAADGRVGMVGAIIPPSPWLLEARYAVVHAAATSLSLLDRYLPADTSSVLEDLYNKGRPVLDDLGVARVPPAEKEDLAMTPQVQAAMFDLAGLLPCSILDEVITRAVLREAARTHTVKAAEIIVPSLDADTEEGAGDDKGKTGKEDKAKEKAKKAPADKVKKGVKKEKGKESEESLFPYPIPPVPRLLAPPIPSKVQPILPEEGEGVDEEAEKEVNAGGADLLRWRYIVYESVRSLIQDDVLFLRQWASRRLQRHLAPRFPFTMLQETQLQNALDLCGGHVLKAAKMMVASHKVNFSCWGDSGRPLNALMNTISGGDKGGSGIKHRQSVGSSDDSLTDAAVVAVDDVVSEEQSAMLLLTNEDDLPTPQVFASGGGARTARTPKTPGTASSSHRHRPHHHDFDWSMEELLTAADRGVAFVSGDRITSSPFRPFADEFMNRAHWLSTVTGMNISEHEAMHTLLEASAGLRSKCLLPEPVNPEIEKQREAELELVANSAAARLMRKDESMKSDADSGPFNLATDDSKGHTQESAIKTAMLHIHPAVAFERLYSLPQVLACTASSTRGLITYQRKLDLARILSMSDLMQPISNSVNNVTSTSSTYSESFECTVDRLGWWCIGASPSAPALVRGRLIFGAGILDALGLQKNASNLRESFSTHSSHSSQSTVSNVSPRHRQGAHFDRSSSTSFFTNSRKFFDPSLDVPRPYVDHSLVAKANQLAESLCIVSVVPLDLDKNVSEWSSPNATVGVVDATLDGMVLGFRCPAVAGSEVYLDVALQSKNGQKERFGPFLVPLDGGEVNVGELSLSNPSS